MNIIGLLIFGRPIFSILCYEKCVGAISLCKNLTNIFSMKVLTGIILQQNKGIKKSLKFCRPKIFATHDFIGKQFVRLFQTFRANVFFIRKKSTKINTLIIIFTIVSFKNSVGNTSINRSNFNLIIRSNFQKVQFFKTADLTLSGVTRPVACLFFESQTKILWSDISWAIVTNATKLFLKIRVSRKWPINF